MNSITQDMKYRQSLLTYAQKYLISAVHKGKKIWYNKEKAVSA